MTYIVDNGPNPTVAKIETVALENENYRTTLWTGKNLQITLMSILPGNDIGLEVHDDHDQFLRIEQGQAIVYMGSDRDNLEATQVNDDDAIIVPAGTWHNIVNDGNESLKLFSIYAPAEHPHGTVHTNKEEAEAAEHN